jgi:hypothetical protein
MGDTTLGELNGSFDKEEVLTARNDRFMWTLLDVIGVGAELTVWCDGEPTWNDVVTMIEDDTVWLGEPSKGQIGLRKVGNGRVEVVKLTNDPASPTRTLAYDVTKIAVWGHT